MGWIDGNGIIRGSRASRRRVLKKESQSKRRNSNFLLCILYRNPPLASLSTSINSVFHFNSDLHERRRAMLVQGNGESSVGTARIEFHLLHL